MKLSKEEIAEEIDHQHKMVRVVRERVRTLELQAARQGIDAPPHITNELSLLREEIRSKEAEISRLETLAAEDQLSVAEAEYRVMLAEVFDTPIGRPSIVGGARLELVRLRHGLSPEISQQLEQEVRVALAEETFADIEPNIYESLPKIVKPLSEALTGEIISGTVQGVVVGVNLGTVRYFYDQPHMRTNTPLQMLGRAIRLDAPTALRLFLILLPMEFELDVEAFTKILLVENRIWVHHSDRVIFEDFLRSLSEALAIRKGRESPA